MNWDILIPIIALGLSLMSLVVQSIKHDKEKLKKVEFAIIRKKRDVNKFKKEKDTDAMMKAQKEMMSLSMEKMKTSMSGTLWTMPIFLLVWFVVLGPMLSVGPLFAGEVSQVGVNLRNLDTMPQNLTVEIVSSDLQVTDTNVREILLDDKGDQGDYKELWWNVTASKGSKQYSIKVSSKSKSDETIYNVLFVSPDSLTADFEPSEMTKLLEGSLEMTPRYHTTRINIFGNVLDWNIFYLLSFFIMAMLLTPFRNHLFWGHHKGVKHLEKMDNSKNE